MKHYKVTVSAEFQITLPARDEDHAEEKANDLDVEDMRCVHWEITDVEEVDD